MTTDDVFEKVRTAIAKEMRVPLERIPMLGSFDELGLDSLDAVNILFELESSFQISIPDTAAKNIRTVPQAVEAVERLLKEQAAGAAGV